MGINLLLLQQGKLLTLAKADSLRKDHLGLGWLLGITVE